MKKLGIWALVFIFFAFSLAVAAQEVKVKISQVSGTQITISLGAREGVSRGIKGKIFHVITNQLTGKSVEVPIGKFSIVEVMDNQSVGNVYDLAPGWQISSKDLAVLEVSSEAAAPQEPVSPPEDTQPQPSAPVNHPASVTSTPLPPNLPGGIPRPTQFPPSTAELKGEELPAPGQTCSLTITTLPVSVMVYVDRQLAGDSPVTLENLAPGKHLIRAVKAPDYGPYIEEINLTPDKKWELAINVAMSTKANLKAGQEAYEKGDFKSASDYLLKAAGYLPMQTEALLYLGSVYQDAGELNNAISMYQAYAYFEPNSLDMRMRMGDIYSLQRNWGKALTSYKLGVLSLSQFQGVNDKLPAASDGTISRYQSLVAAHPGNLNYRILLGCLYEKKGRMKDGATEFKAVLKKCMANQ